MCLIEIDEEGHIRICIFMMRATSVVSPDILGNDRWVDRTGRPRIRDASYVTDI